MTGLVYKDEVYKIMGAAMEVASELGSGFLEAVYQEALSIELEAHGIPHVPQKRIDIYYKGQRLDKIYVADFCCYGHILVEIKAIKAITPVEIAQILNYLKATEMPLGLLINFGSPRLEWKRYANTKNKKRVESTTRVPQR